MEFRKAFLSLRWLLIILTCYLTLFSSASTEYFAAIAIYVALFGLSNLILTWISPDRFLDKDVQRATHIADVVFVSIALSILHVPGTYLHLAFAAVFIMAVIWRELVIALFSIGVVSVLYSMFTWFPFDPQVKDAREEFLTLALLFVVADFYVFLSERLRQEKTFSRMMREETRRAEVMGEITRSLSSSLDSTEILYLIVTRLCEVANAEDVLIVQLGGDLESAEIVVRASEPNAPVTPIVLGEHPVMMSALESMDLRSITTAAEDGPGGTLIAVPMVVNDTVTGLIHIQLAGVTGPLSDLDARFYKIMAGTAANALRNAQLFEETQRLARTDFLTGLPNHRTFQSTLATELARAQRHDHPLTLLIIDLDYMKTVNDRFGHPSGDMVLRAIAQTIRDTCRDNDFAARYGGEEFMVILPETPLEGGVQAAERIRERIAFVDFPQIGRLTASIGLANYPTNAVEKEDLIRIADQALYVAKNQGRDRVVSFNYQLITR
ncbi:MAG TPA: diguanylate cyclase [Terriglobia bacterium]|nr:diguanylate cyclase [Terriglobia bacterium]